MIKTIIVEDEQYTRKGIISLVQQLNPAVDFIAECASVDEASVLIKACKPDLVLLDINLQGGSGFDVLDNTEELDFSVIFITAYNQHAIRALKCGAIDYILKPVDPDELRDALEKVSAGKYSTRKQLDIFKEQLSGNQNRIVLRLQESYQIIELAELVYCKSDAGYTTFFLNDGRKFIASRPLKEYVTQLPNDRFVRTHQSYMVNIDYVDRYDKTRFAYLKDDTPIPVSIRKREEFVKKVFEA
ncbi:DNA-binding response regulator [Fulvitalea axinellae]|uniref:DNA-binding response regulator n=1 Tax=Fulvitalea axinellae TaxID=1182444 RepID=A0AAU9CJJ6_9BACT|nr:DNA-binding response regulator [Fulvitalea axinellae]